MAGRVGVFVCVLVCLPDIWSLKETKTTVPGKEGENNEILTIWLGYGYRTGFQAVH